MFTDRPFGSHLPRAAFDADPPPPAPPAPAPAAAPPAPAPAPVEPPAARPGETPEQARIRELNHESMTHRLAAKNANELLAESRAALQAAQGQTAQVRQELEGRVSSAQGLVDKFRTAAINSAVMAHAAAAGIIDPDIVSLIPKAGVTVDDNGDLVGADAAVAAFKTAKPQFFRGAAAAAAPAPGPGSLLPTAPAPAADPGTKPVKEMTKQEYDASRRNYIAGLKGRRAG